MHHCCKIMYCRVMPTIELPQALEFPPSPAEVRDAGFYEPGPYRLRVWVQTISGRPAIVGVEMWGVEPPKRVQWDPLPSLEDGLPESAFPGVPITSKRIRVPLGKILDDWVGLILGIADEQVKWTDPGQQIRVDLLTEEITRKDTGRAALTDDFLQFVATAYLEAQSAGSRHPTKDVGFAVEREMGIFGAGSTPHSWVKAARDRGFLPPANKRTAR